MSRLMQSLVVMIMLAMAAGAWLSWGTFPRVIELVASGTRATAMLLLLCAIYNPGRVRTLSYPNH